MHERAVLLVQLATTLPLVGLIWTIQVVHYPLFRHAGEREFAAYHEQHTRRITWVVMPLMLTELAGSAAMLRWTPSVCTVAAAWAGIGLVAAAWLCTALLSVPAHNRLAQGKDDATIAALVITNWIRTAAWTLRGAGLLYGAYLIFGAY